MSLLLELTWTPGCDSSLLVLCGRPEDELDSQEQTWGRPGSQAEMSQDLVQTSGRPGRGPGSALDPTAACSACRNELLFFFLSPRGVQDREPRQGSRSCTKKKKCSCLHFCNWPRLVQADFELRATGRRSSTPLDRSRPLGGTLNSLYVEPANRTSQPTGSEGPGLNQKFSHFCLTRVSRV